MPDHDQTSGATIVMDCCGTADDERREADERADERGLPEPLVCLQKAAGGPSRRFYEF